MPQFARHRSHDFGGRGTFAFDNKRRHIGLVSVADVLQDSLLLRQGAGRTRTQRMKGVLARAVRKSPTGILAAEACDDGL